MQRLWGRIVSTQPKPLILRAHSAGIYVGLLARDDWSDSTVCPTEEVKLIGEQNAYRAICEHGLLGNTSLV